ncbi:39S ribosomal protein L46, mitochondrial-like isoform X2 [Paramacrobiotus metropolitanus]|nr:39S ribosomal protein L46, mitochondrial-like isoform X2 [Paramacrobiotus metropolitanus]
MAGYFSTSTTRFPTSCLEKFCKALIRNRSTTAIPTTLHPSLLLDPSNRKNRTVDRNRDGSKISSENKDKKWQLWGAICLERSAIVSPHKNPIEENFQNLFLQEEFEKSLFSDHEMRKFEDARKAKRRKDADLSVEEDSDIVVQTAQDKEDSWNELYEKFKPAPRITESDQKNDTRATNRKLDRKLYLVVNQKLGDSARWVFPQGAWQGSESLYETAADALRRIGGTDLQFMSLGSTPVGFYRYKYPISSKIAKDFYGAKVFFFKALLRKGSVTPSSEVEDYQWMTREELQQTVTDKYFDRVERFLFEFNDRGLKDVVEHEQLMKMSF